MKTIEFPTRDSFRVGCGRALMLTAAWDPAVARRETSTLRRA